MPDPLNSESTPMQQPAPESSVASFDPDKVQITPGDSLLETTSPEPPKTPLTTIDSNPDIIKPPTSETTHFENVSPLKDVLTPNPDAPTERVAVPKPEAEAAAPESVTVPPVLESPGPEALPIATPPIARPMTEFLASTPAPAEPISSPTAVPSSPTPEPAPLPQTQAATPDVNSNPGLLGRIKSFLKRG